MEKIKVKRTAEYNNGENQQGQSRKKRTRGKFGEKTMEHKETFDEKVNRIKRKKEERQSREKTMDQKTFEDKRRRKKKKRDMKL